MLTVLYFPVSAGSLEVVRKIPHTGYSEGLDFHDGYLWHALPKEIVKIDPKDGSILSRFQPATAYSESIVWLNEKLFNLSFSDNGIYVGILKKSAFEFKRVGDTPEAHGWGIVFDGKHVVMTGNYSNKLYFLDPKSMKVVRSLTVSVSDLEDLAWDGMSFWTSSYTSHKGSIFSVHPTKGTVEGFYVLPDPKECPVIDGIAYDNGNFWVTGKNCASLYLVKNPILRAISSRPKKRELSR